MEMLTVYAFSTENWKRDQAEIDTLMGIFQTYCAQVCSAPSPFRSAFLSALPSHAYM